MRKIEIDRTVTTRTPVTEDILDMLKKMNAWKPKTLEQVITVCERLIHAANEDIFYGARKNGKKDKVSYFQKMQGKLIKYPNGIANSTEYLYVTSVEFDEREWDTTANLTGLRLTKYNRIGNDTLQVYTLPVRFGMILDIKPGAFMAMMATRKITYELVSGSDEYADAVARMKAFVPALSAVPDTMIRDNVKINLPKRRFTKVDLKNDYEVEPKPTLNKGGKKCQIRPTSTTTDRAASKSCAEPSDTTSSSRATTGRCTRQQHASATSRRNASKKSPQSSKSS